MEESNKTKTGTTAEEKPTQIGLSYLNMRNIRCESVSLPSQTLVRSSYLEGTGALPLVIEPKMEGVDVARWARGVADYLERELELHGAILFRGFKAEGVEKFDQLARTLTPHLLDYRERSSPRSEVIQGIYTSTDHPADQFIHFHNELSYARCWPMKLWFYCQQVAVEGGATPIADGRKVLAMLDPGIIRRFMDKRVMYVRNYGDGLGLSWQNAFQTASRQAVENYCRSASINYEWKSGGRLKTRQVFNTVEQHPRTKEKVWFEHAAFFHVSGVDPEIRKFLLAEFKEEDLPSNTYYGDGSPIEDSALEEIREVYRQNAATFLWQEGDVMLIDNMLVSHSRQPFVGPRKVLVAMAELYRPEGD
jgi:alpha-ketoglutarate-dependent taurine dioxygenase